MNIEQAAQKVLSKHSDSIITMRLELPTRFVFSLEPKNWKGGTLMDPFFAVDKKTGAISEFVPSMDLDNFKKAVKRLN